MGDLEKTVLIKEIRARVEHDYKEYAPRRARGAADELTSVERACREIRLKTICPNSLARLDGTVTCSQEEMAELIRDF